MHADAEPGNRGCGEPLLYECSARKRVLSGDEIGRNVAGMLGEALRQRLERRVGIGPEDLVGAHFPVRGNGAFLETRSAAEL